METNKQGEMETVDGRLLLSIPEGPLFDVLSRVPIKDLHRFKIIPEWRNLFINFPDSRKNLPQTLQGFFYVSYVRDSAGNKVWKFHFLDLLARSMPVPDDMDTEGSFIWCPDHVGSIELLCSCNGLLLFGCKKGSERYHSLGYIVCNPATKQSRKVPSSGWVLPENHHPKDEDFESTFLFFDPAEPSRFLLIQFWHNDDAALEGVHTYSSKTKTGKWSNRYKEGGWMQFAKEGEWGDEYGVYIHSGLGSSFLNGRLHFFVRRMKKQDVLIVAVDGEGNICRIRRWPLIARNWLAVFIGQSQGCLHCISADSVHKNEDQKYRTIMYVDVLQDYEAEEVQIGKKFGIRGGILSGGKECRRKHYEVVAFHPDGDLIYFVDHKNGELIQYDPKKEQVLRLSTDGHICTAVPYVPCFSWSSALETTGNRILRRRWSI